MGQRVRILELGDGRSSRFSHHGRYLVGELSGCLVFPLDINYLNMLSWPWPRMLAVLGMIVGLKSSSNIGCKKKGRLLDSALIGDCLLKSFISGTLEVQNWEV